MFGTIHSASTVEAIERIMNIFPPNQMQQILNQLSNILVAAVSRELLPRKGGGARVASWEIMVNTPAVSNLIRENRLASIFSAMQIGAKDGMTTMEQSKTELRAKGLIRCVAPTGIRMKKRTIAAHAMSDATMIYHEESGQGKRWKLQGKYPMILYCNSPSSCRRYSSCSIIAG